ncbi:MAG: hypothetical protein K2X32_00495, partial [Phycisphaerales bacterium]|nr:hypothetical protein [Phycisphaerales bacterium]
MTLRYWHKLAILIACIALGGVVLTASYAHVLSRQAMARDQEDRRSLATAILSVAAELIINQSPAAPEASPTRPGDSGGPDPLAIAAERIAPAILRNELLAEARIRRVSVCRVEKKTVNRVYVLAATASGDPPSPPPPPPVIEPMPLDLRQHLMERMPKRGVPIGGVSTGRFEGDDGTALYHP